MAKGLLLVVAKGAHITFFNAKNAQEKASAKHEGLRHGEASEARGERDRASEKFFFAFHPTPLRLRFCASVHLSRLSFRVQRWKEMKGWEKSTTFLSRKTRICYLVDYWKMTRHLKNVKFYLEISHIPSENLCLSLLTLDPTTNVTWQQVFSYIRCKIAPGVYVQ